MCEYVCDCKYVCGDSVRTAVLVIKYKSKQQLQRGHNCFFSFKHNKSKRADTNWHCSCGLNIDVKLYNEGLFVFISTAANKDNKVCNCLLTSMFMSQSKRYYYRKTGWKTLSAQRGSRGDKAPSKDLNCTLEVWSLGWIKKKKKSSHYIWK